LTLLSLGFGIERGQIQNRVLVCGRWSGVFAGHV
jgi:hypothetical protein